MCLHCFLCHLEKRRNFFVGSQLNYGRFHLVGIDFLTAIAETDFFGVHLIKVKYFKIDLLCLIK